MSAGAGLRIAAILGLCAAAGCAHTGGGVDAPMAIDRFRMMSAAGMAEAGLNPEDLTILPEMHRLQDLDRCLVRFRHRIYEQDASFLDPDDVYEREGYLLLLGERGGRVVGLTTQCALNFEHPKGFDLVDPAEDLPPEIVAGVIELEHPDKDYPPETWLTAHEADRSHVYWKDPSSFNSKFFEAMGMTRAGWERLLESGRQVRYQPIGRNDLAFVYFERERDIGFEPRWGPEGATVPNVRAGSVADRAGIRPGDVVVAIGDARVGSAKDWRRAVERCPSNERVEIRLRRPEGLGEETLSIRVDPKAGLGCDVRWNGSGFLVEAVAKGGPGARGGCKVDDVLISIGGSRLRAPEDLSRLLARCPADADVELRVRRPRFAEVQAEVAFGDAGTMIGRGEARTLGLREPERIVEELLRELDKLGGMLRRELLVHCHVCVSRIDKAKLATPLTPWGALLELAPFAAGLVGADAAVRLALYEGDRGYRSFTAAFNVFSEVSREVRDLQKFLKENQSLGKPYYLDPAAVRVTGGDSFEATDMLGRRVRARLAHVISKEPEARRHLEGIVRGAAASGRLLVAVPDGVDYRGAAHCHVLVGRPDELAAAARDFSRLSSFVLDGYVNLVMVRQGAASAFDHRVGDGRSTRYILRALRALDRTGE
jgi:hypothetical protein